MRALAAVALTLLLVLPQGAAAEPGGCSVFTTGHDRQPGNCRYTASGPGTYTVRSLSGFRISASSDGGLTWRTVASKTGLPNMPHTAVAVEEGAIDTRAGELVDVAIGLAVHGELSYKNGSIEAGDA